MTLMQRKSPLIKVMFYVGMRSSSLCMRRLTLREKKKISPHPACASVKIIYNILITNIMNEQYMDQARRSWEYKAKKRSVRVKTV